MNIKERLSFFQEIVQCEYPLHLWRYDPDFELLETNCPAELMLPDIISMLGFSSLSSPTLRMENVFRLFSILNLVLYGLPDLNIRGLS